MKCLFEQLLFVVELEHDDAGFSTSSSPASSSPVVAAISGRFVQHGSHLPMITELGPSVRPTVCLVITAKFGLATILAEHEFSTDC